MSIANRDKVVIIGGGIVGLLTAYYAAKNGFSTHVVTLREFENSPSWMNAGYLASGFGSPIPEESLSKLLGLVLSSETPVKISPIFFLKNIFPDGWVYQYFKSKEKRESVDFLRAVREICVTGSSLLREFIKESGIEPELNTNGILEVYLNMSKLVEKEKLLNKLRRYFPVNFKMLTSDECLSLEPNLSEKIAGGILYEEDSSVNPAKLMASLTKYLETSGVTRITYARVVSLEVENGRAKAAVTDNGDRIFGEYFVVSAGMGSARILGSIGVRVSLAAGFGYSIMTEPVSAKMNRPVVGGEFRVATSQTSEGNLRASGFFELRESPPKNLDKRYEELAAKAAEYIPLFRRLKIVKKNFGARPCTPHGLPYVGPTRFPNLFICVGHCRLGLTTGAVTAKSLADLLSGKESRYLSLLSPTRTL